VKYAIISDIHGNLPALQAVLLDSKVQGADKYLLIGDYVTNYTWCNEVTETISKLTNATVIGGNHEGYLRSLSKIDEKEWKYDQFRLVYWTYRELTPENLNYLMNLPETATVEDCGGVIYLAHASNVFFRQPRMRLFHSDVFREMMENKPFTHEEYLAAARESLLSCPDVLNDILALPKGVYLFGHNHLQFYMEYEGRLFINPGSCGEPLDCDTTAPYTLLEYVNNRWVITERRVAYDIDAVAIKLRESPFSTYTPIWSELVMFSLLNGKDNIGAFLAHVEKVSQKYGQTEKPVSNDIWNTAVKTWTLR